MVEPEPIFGPYWNGQANVWADPLRVRRLLQAGLEGKVDVWCERTKSEDPAERSAALGKIVQAAIVAFGMAPFDPRTGKGIREAEALRTTQLFLDWINGKKASTRVCPTSSLPTDSGEPQPTKSTLDSLSTSVGSEDEFRPQLPRLPKSLSPARPGTPASLSRTP